MQLVAGAKSKIYVNALILTRFCFYSDFYSTGICIANDQRNQSLITNKLQDVLFNKEKDIVIDMVPFYERYLVDIVTVSKFTHSTILAVTIKLILRR